MINTILLQKPSNGSLKQSIETALDSEQKDLEGISKHEKTNAFKYIVNR